MRNKEWIICHLREAAEELTRTITALKSNPKFDEINLEIAMAHMYNHLNTAWNSRKARADRIRACSEEDFYTWRGFPEDISMGKV